MIVTKAHEKKFLIRKNCWLLEPAENGDFKIVNTSIHWKEGMEVFESMEDCLAELKRRTELKMSEGKCPRCNYKNLQGTDRDITHLTFIQNAKAGKLYGCDSCGTVWYKDKSPKALAYDAAQKDQIIDWANRELKPSKEIENILYGIGDISTSKNEMEFPAHVTLKRGFELPYALIRLEKHPPDQNRFKRKTWHFLDEVKEIRPSPNAYPYPIAKYIRANYDSFIDIRSKTGTDIIRFDGHAGIFMPVEFIGSDFELVHNVDPYDKNIKIVYQPADRGGPDFWSVTPPEKPTVILGEF